MDGRKKPKTKKWYDAMAAKKGTTARNQYSKSIELGLPRPEISPETRKKLSESNKRRGPVSDITKERISQSRIKFLRENPDKVPYRLNHYSKGRSYPESYWKDILDSKNIAYIEQYQIGPYQLDFAIILSEFEKIDFEIDGEQHYLDKRIIASDIRRTEYLENLGWKILRVRWSEYQKLVDKRSFVNYIIGILDPVAQ